MTGLTTLTFDEFKKIAKGLKAVYTSKDFLPDEDSLKIWYHMLKDLTYEQVSTSCYKYMATGKFAPTIAEIRAAAAQITKPETEKDWSDGWEQLMRAIRRFGYYQQEAAFSSMDDITRTVTRRLGWKELCMSENLIADRANFRMAYEQEQTGAKDKAALPEGLKKQIEAMQDNALPLTAGNHKEGKQ